MALKAGLCMNVVVCCVGGAVWVRWALTDSVESNLGDSKNQYCLLGINLLMNT